MTDYILYARRSTESDDHQILSIASQIKELLSLAQDRGFTVSRILSESESARAPGREVFQAMLKEISAGKADGILCWKLDRLARNPVDGGAVIWSLEERRLQRIVTPQRTYENSGNDKFWMQLEFGMAKKYVDDLAEDVKRGLRAKVERGWLPRKAPLGYLNDRALKRITPDPERFLLVRKIWELAASGTPIPKLLRVVNEQWGFRTPQTPRMGNSPLSRSGLYRILKSRFYYGVIEFSGQLYAGAHTPMISRGQYERVQEVLGGKRRRVSKKHSFPYTQLMTCRECGCSVTASEIVKPSGRSYVYYHCTKKGATRCPGKYVPAAEIERQIHEYVNRVTVPPKLEKWAQQQVRKRREDRSIDEVARASARKALEESIMQLRRLADLSVRGLIDAREHEKRRATLQEDIGRLSGQAESAPPKEENDHPSVDSADSLAERIHRVLQHEDHTKTRMVLSTIGTFSLGGKRLFCDLHRPFSFQEEMLPRES